MKDLVILRTHDADLYLMMKHILAAAGFRASQVDRSPAADPAILAETIAVLVDCSGEIEDVISFCKEIKTVGRPTDIPVVALIPAKHEGSYLKLLKAGVDDGFVRPFAPEKLIQHLQGMAATFRQDAAAASLTADFGGLSMDDDSRLISSQGRSKHLSPIEYRLLRAFANNPGRVLSRAELIAAAWPGNRHVLPRTVDVHIAKLRQHLDATLGQQLIRTVRSSGFIVDVVPAQSYGSVSKS